jgi:beta-1,2-mannobiose phosphorylase / 1,2-beta-oligomannan phosphorylase
MIKLKRYVRNPIITPIPEHEWEARSTFNPTAIYLDNKVHILYRAMSKDNTSTIGYAVSNDGVTISKRLDHPIYVPRLNEEKKKKPGGHSGCEDARITKIGDKLYICYTAFDTVGPTRIAMSSIKIDDFLKQKWNWSKPKIISPPGIDDKNCCIVPNMKNGKYGIFHRIYPCIWIDFVDDLEFKKKKWIKGSAWFKPRTDSWDSRKIGIAGPPIKTDAGWLLLYHGISEKDRHYRVGAMLLDLENPTHVLARSKDPLLEPRLKLEMQGDVNNVVYPCGAVVKEGTLYVYYGGADIASGVAAVKLDKLIYDLLNQD